MRFLFDSFRQNWALPWQNLEFSSLYPKVFSRVMSGPPRPQLLRPSQLPFRTSFFRFSRTSCTTSEWTVHPCARKSGSLIYYRLYESLEDSSNQPEDPMGSPRRPHWPPQDPLAPPINPLGALNRSYPSPLTPWDHDSESRINSRTFLGQFVLVSSFSW